MIKEFTANDLNTAVVAIIVYGSRVLLLKRDDPPYNWCPPCGHAMEGESLEDALYREVEEETGLTVEIENYVQTWEGVHDGEKIKSFTFICYANSHKVTLSDEHTDFSWVNIDELSAWESKTDFELRKWPEWIEGTST